MEFSLYNTRLLLSNEKEKEKQYMNKYNVGTLMTNYTDSFM